MVVNGQNTSRARSALPGFATLALVAALSACQTIVDIPPDLSPAGFFQAAQDASSGRNPRAAMAYYEEFRVRFGDDPNELARLLWADYEVAFLHHKLGDDARAVNLLRELIDHYADSTSADWPVGPETLARRVLAELEADAAANAPPPTDNTAG
jgi:hypothetical protein